MAASKKISITGRGLEILRGPLILASRQWGVLIFGAKFYAFREKNKTKNVFFENIFLGGHFFSARKIKFLTPSPKPPQP